ncbi:MAG: hypothetical protein NTV34_03515 [Proteobacteria bacterium]|nr:hypothetical protein [Pseudomonadota bacterium]
MPVSVEPLAEFARHEAWLHRYSQTLSGFGYTQSDQNWYLTQGKKSFFNEHVRWDYHSDLCENIRTFQNALLPMTRALNPIIEVCLTSNLRIGQLAKVEYHPIKRFMKAGIRLTISTDDPGIFAIGLFAEESLLKSSFSLGQEDLNIFELEARNVLRT